MIPETLIDEVESSRAATNTREGPEEKPVHPSQVPATARIGKAPHRTLDHLNFLQTTRTGSVPIRRAVHVWSVWCGVEVETTEHSLEKPHGLLLFLKRFSLSKLAS